MCISEEVNKEKNQKVGKKPSESVIVIQRESHKQVAIATEVEQKDAHCVPLIVLLDTGACVSLITSKFIHKEGITVMDIGDQTANITSVQGHHTKNEATGKIKLNRARTCSFQEVLIARDIELPSPVLLGTGFMLKHNISLKILPSQGMWELKVQTELIPLEHMTAGEVAIIRELPIER